MVVGKLAKPANQKACFCQTFVLPLVPKGNITLKSIWLLTRSGLCDDSSNLFSLTLEYV